MTTQTNELSVSLAVRVDATNPLHHLWNNNGSWWCHFTVHLPGYQKKRIRMSLQTDNSEEALRKRDQLFTLISNQNPNE